MHHTQTVIFLAGLVGVIPALGMMTPKQNPPNGPIKFSVLGLILWSLALAFIGVFCAVPLRIQTIIKEKLRFPSGTATANVIRTLHQVPENETITETFRGVSEDEGPRMPPDVPREGGTAQGVPKRHHMMRNRRNQGGAGFTMRPTKPEAADVEVGCSRADDDGCSCLLGSNK